MKPAIGKSPLSHTVKVHLGLLANLIFFMGKVNNTCYGCQKKKQKYSLHNLGAIAAGRHAKDV